MKKSLLLLAVLYSCTSFAIVYDNYEINHELNQADLQHTTQQFLTAYFTAKQPSKIVDSLLKDATPPIQREYILYSLLTEISQQPPQDFHQHVIDLMKTFPSQAYKTHEEGHINVPIFNLSSKAHGIENIWTAYQTEQQFNQLFNKDLTAAVAAAKPIIQQHNRPQWLGVKNSIAALSLAQQNQLAAYLINNIQKNTGLDRLISHVGLINGNITLIEKALHSEQQSIREFTLRKVSQHLLYDQAKSILLKAATLSDDKKISTSLLSKFSNDKEVQSFLINQLNHKSLADNAAFALSQSTDSTLPQQLKSHYLQTNQALVKNYILMALKLNQSTAATLALDDLQKYIEPNSKGSKWIDSFEPIKVNKERSHE